MEWKTPGKLPGLVRLKPKGRSILPLDLLEMEAIGEGVCLRIGFLEVDLHGLDFMDLEQKGNGGQKNIHNLWKMPRLKNRTGPEMGLAP